jgi:exosome complex component RRP42
MSSAAERTYIVKGAEQNIRNDGRRREEIRSIELELDVIPQANGSARVRLGATDVIVGVKAEIASPDLDRPDSGKLVCSVECSPLANPSYKGRGGEELSSELTKLVERSMFSPSSSSDSSSSPIPLSSLSIIPGKTCWAVYVDALVLSIDGTPIDAISIAIKAALASTLLPKVDLIAGEDPDDEPDYELDDDPSSALQLDTSGVPVILSVGLLGNGPLVVDMTGEEAGCAGAVLQVAVNGGGEVCGVTKRNTKALDPGTMMQMVAMAQTVGRGVHGCLEGYINKNKMKRGGER